MVEEEGLGFLGRGFRERERELKMCNFRLLDIFIIYRSRLTRSSR